MVRKAVIPIAGYGTRCLPFSKAVPKSMINVVSTPVIQLIVNELISSGIKYILFVEGNTGQIVQSHFTKNSELENFFKKRGDTKRLNELNKIHSCANFYFTQVNEILGSGYSILAAKNWVGNEPFIVLCGDEFFVDNPPVVQQLIDVYEKTGKSVIATAIISDEERNKFGIIEGECLNNDFEIIHMIEKPKINETCSNYAGMGRYLLTPDIFYYLERVKPSAGGEIQLTDAMQMKISEKHDILAHIYNGKRYDCGNKLSYMVASIEMALTDKEISKELKEYLINLVKKEFSTIEH